MKTLLVMAGVLVIFSGLLLVYFLKKYKEYKKILREILEEFYGGKNE